MKGLGNVTYIHVENLKICLEDMKIERNGAQNIGKKRIPRKDIHKFVGPMPELKKYIQEEVER